MRLSPAVQDRLATSVERYRYDRSEQAAGIVHFGIGAFHRAHQAWYTDRAMDAGDRGWAITGISLRSPNVARQLNPQGGLYTLTERGAAGDATRLIGVVRGVIVARETPEAAIANVAARDTRIISFTVTEKGYCRAADGSVDQAAAAKSDLYRILGEGLRRRRDAALPGVTLLSCDNLAQNGALLGRLFTEYLDRHDPALVSWFARECACPSAMVDRIVPATTDADRKELADRIGVEDAGAVFTEPYCQWVLEDRFAGPRPRWESVGAQFVADIAPYEDAKLRLLNAAHSALAYLGLERGHTYVHEAIADPALRRLVERLLRREAAPTVDAAPGQDLEAYAGALLARFANPSLRHRLSQIAIDGSQKIPERWLPTLGRNQARGRSCPALLAAIAAWLRHLRGANGAVDDPRAEELAPIVSGPDSLPALFGAGGILASPWTPTLDDLERLATELEFSRRA